MATVTTSPGVSQGVPGRAMATLEGVPVRMMSPGWRVMPWDRSDGGQR